MSSSDLLLSGSEHDTSEQKYPAAPQQSFALDTEHRTLAQEQVLPQLRALGSGMFFITLFIGLAQAAQILGLGLAHWDVDSGWMATWQGYRFLINASLGTLIWGVLVYCSCRNLGNTFTLHDILAGFWLLLVLAQVVWSLVDIFWYCGNKLPDFCTDTVTSTIEMSYWFYAVGIWFEFIFLIADIVVTGVIKRHVAVLRSAGKGQMTAEIYKAFVEPSVSYVKHIGSAFRAY